MSVLLLGGSAEARSLAELLQSQAVPFVSSLAGAVRDPRLPVGEVRIGGFGGVPGLLDFLRQTQTRAVIDATHPFAAGISSNAAQACESEHVPLLRLQRPGWGDRPDAASWTWVADHHEAARVAAELDAPVLLTTGRRHLEHFVGPLRRHRVVVRVVDPVAAPLPEGWTVLTGRGPYALEDERALLQQHQIGVLVTKDSGGSMTVGKLDAAAELGAQVVVVHRPPTPPRVPTVANPEQAVTWLRATLPA